MKISHSSSSILQPQWWCNSMSRVCRFQEPWSLGWRSPHISQEDPNNLHQIKSWSSSKKNHVLTGRSQQFGSIKSFEAPTNKQTTYSSQQAPNNLYLQKMKDGFMFSYKSCTIENVWPQKSTAVGGSHIEPFVKIKGCVCWWWRVQEESTADLSVNWSILLLGEALQKDHLFAALESVFLWIPPYHVEAIIRYEEVMDLYWRKRAKWLEVWQTRVEKAQSP